MFLLRKNLFSVIIPHKFTYYRPNLPFLFWPIRCVRSIAISFESIPRSLFMFNASLSVFLLLFSSTPWISEKFRREYCSCWSMLSSRTFDLSVRSDTFSFKFFYNFNFFLTFFLIFIKLICNKIWLILKDQRATVRL